MELKHQQNGLESGFVIKSQTTGKEWRVKSRILFSHTIDKQKKFTNESTLFWHSSFGSVEDMLSFSKNILDKEGQGIFQYQLESIGQHSKPVAGDILIPAKREKIACPCCGFRTIDSESKGSYNICHVCFWEDDPIQLEDPDYESGANRMSLRQAQQNFLSFGACDKEMLRNVRPPAKDEERDENWKPLNTNSRT